MNRFKLVPRDIPKATQQYFVKWNNITIGQAVLLYPNRGQSWQIYSTIAAGRFRHIEGRFTEDEVFSNLLEKAKKSGLLKPLDLLVERLDHVHD